VALVTHAKFRANWCKYSTDKGERTNHLTNSIEHICSEHNSHIDNQEIAHVLQNPKYYHRGYKNPQFVPIMSQMNPVHILSLHFNILLSSRSRSFKWNFTFRFSN